MCGLGGSTAAREGVARAPQAAPSRAEVPPSPEVVEVVADSMTRERPTPLVATNIVITRPMAYLPPLLTTPGLAAPSVASGLGVAKMSITIPSNAVVTLDPVLAERMFEFTVQPHDRRERSGKQLMATITDLFPQLLEVSFLFHSPFFIAYVDLTDISIAKGSHRHFADPGLLPSIGPVGCLSATESARRPRRWRPGLGRVGVGLGGVV